MFMVLAWNSMDNQKTKENNTQNIRLFTLYVRTYTLKRLTECLLFFSDT